MTTTIATIARCLGCLGCLAVPLALLACGSREAAPSAARGEYLAKLMGCPACHSPDPARPYAGGLESWEPGGPWRSSNLTPHLATGIGSWTDAQILAAIRDGVRPDGRRLHPIMPCRYYRRLTDADATAVVAFLRSLAPIDHAVAPSPPPLPPSPRSPPPPAPPPPPPAPAPAAPLQRGEYLVALMHCASCHATPTADGSPDPARPFAGGKAMRPFGAGLASVGTGTLVAPNITPDLETGIGAWTADDLARSIRSLVRPDGTAIRGPMQLYAAGWAVIDDRDLAAIATYLKQLPPVRNQVPRATFQAGGAP
jgi:mono/diheme cytochrome c family protein